MLESFACYLGVEKGTLLVPFSILLSSFIGAGVAIWAVINNWRLAERNHQLDRHLTKQKNSMDFLNGFNAADDITKATKEVAALWQSSRSEMEDRALGKSLDGDNAKTAHIRTVLNYYESMAICIHHEIYDEEIIKGMVYSTVIKIWDICLPYVEEKNRSKKTTTFYQELRILVERWENEPLEKK